MKVPVLRVHLAFTDTRLRGKAETLFRSLGFDVVVTDTTQSLSDIDLTDAMLVIETGDDAALLTRLIYELYLKNDHAGTLPIIGIVSTTALKISPSLCFWTTNGHAAVLAVLTNDSSLESNLYSFGRRIKTTSEEEPRTTSHQ